jgi:hypothetical protein
VADEESWYLRMRKTHHTEHLLDLVPPELREPDGVLGVYGGVGNPPFHYETVHRFRAELARRRRNGENLPESFEALGRLVLDAFHQTSRRYADGKLRFLYGFGLDDLAGDRVSVDGEDHPIGQAVVRDRARMIANLEEGFEDAPLAPPNHVCLVGWDRVHGFQGFCIKQEDGVLSLQAGGFESMGQGRYAGALIFQKVLEKKTLDERIEGVDLATGLVTLLSSIVEAGDHFGQVGGCYNFYLVDGTGRDVAERVRYVQGDTARLAVEIVRAHRGGFLKPGAAAGLLNRLVVKKEAFRAVEKALFKAARSSRTLDLVLRGYKHTVEDGDVRSNTFMSP